MVINDNNFQEVAAENKLLVLDFWATWCGPCRKVSPVIDGLAAQYSDKANIGKVNIEEDADELVAQFGIRNIPTVLFIKNGEVVDKVVGAATKNVYEDKINALL